MVRPFCPLSRKELRVILPGDDYCYHRWFYACLAEHYRLQGQQRYTANAATIRALTDVLDSALSVQRTLQLLDSRGLITLRFERTKNNNIKFHIWVKSKQIFHEEESQRRIDAEAKKQMNRRSA